MAVSEFPDSGTPSLASSLGRKFKDWVPFLALVFGLAIALELIKFIAGSVTPIEFGLFGLHVSTVWHPPLQLRFASDLGLPHLWNIAAALAQPEQRDGPILFGSLLQAALFTFREAATGFAIGGLFGLGLAILLVHSNLLERALVPYVIASQTVPLLAVAPMVVVWLQADWLSVAVISAYLSFFPVTIASLRGLRSVHPDALDLMRSYAASRRQVLFMVRLPAAAPYLFTGLKLAATVSVVGAIVGELPSGISGGLGVKILNYNQYYITGPERLWAAMLVAALLGITAYLLVTAAERIILRGRYRSSVS